MTLAGPQVLAMPVALAEQGLALRPETEADVPFLRRLYISTRWEELAPVIDWTDEQKIAFLESQFESAGTPMGRLYIDRQADAMRVIDIALLPEWRGRGIGTALMEAVLAEARATGKEIGISVEKFNPALRLYQRLGFREYADDGIYWFMSWRPDAGEAALS
jgi:ribosomal protein S18 acetylase RimI-like enzyme